MREGGLRVPCIIKWPGKIDNGRVIENFISSLEIFPTLLEIAGVDKPDSIVIDGFSILPLLTGEKDLARDEMFWEFREEYAARIGNMKWIKSERREQHNGLFDLSNDVAEQNDLSELNPFEYKMVTEKFYSWQEKMAEVEPREPFKDF